MIKMFAIILLFLPLQVQAVWSAFAYVSPETENKYNLNIEFKPIGAGKNTYRIKLIAVGYDHKRAWLITSTKRLSEKEQELRDYVWQPLVTNEFIVSKRELHPKGEGNNLYYEVELESEEIENSYIYIDFPTMYEDGGYYYSIDLYPYLMKYKNNPIK